MLSPLSGLANAPSSQTSPASSNISGSPSPVETLCIVATSSCECSGTDKNISPSNHRSETFSVKDGSKLWGNER